MEPAHDRGVGECADHVGLPLEPGQGGGVGGLVRPDHLDHHRGEQVLVEGQVGLVRGAATQQADGGQSGTDRVTLGELPAAAAHAASPVLVGGRRAVVGLGPGPAARRNGRYGRPSAAGVVPAARRWCSCGCGRGSCRHRPGSSPSSGHGGRGRGRG